MSELTGTNLFESQSLLTDHKDLIHDVAYDFYGERMATCSSDQYVKIWDSDGQGNWKMSASWKAHHGSIWKVTWAHPEFGQVIATCSFDRTAAIWEEVGDAGTVLGPEKGTKNRNWVKRSNLIDSRTSVTDVKFGPKHLGLLIVTCSADGIIRIYEAPDVMNLAQWTLQHEIPTKVSISCLSWNPSLSRVNPPMLGVGSDEPAPAGGQPDKPAANNGKVFIYEYSEGSRRWTRTDCLASVQEAVHDLAFAPNLGRSFHLLAVATKDVKIIKIEPETSNANTGNGLTARFKTEVVAAFDEHDSCVWRVAWNVTGTLLASSGDDCCVRLWKSQYLREWRCCGVFDNERGSDSAPPSRTTATYMRLAPMDNPRHMRHH